MQREHLQRPQPEAKVRRRRIAAVAIAVLAVAAGCRDGEPVPVNNQLPTTTTERVTTTLPATTTEATTTTAKPTTTTTIPTTTTTAFIPPPTEVLPIPPPIDIEPTVQQLLAGNKYGVVKGKEVYFESNVTSELRSEVTETIEEINALGDYNWHINSGVRDGGPELGELVVRMWKGLDGICTPPKPGHVVGGCADIGTPFSNYGVMTTSRMAATFRTDLTGKLLENTVHHELMHSLGFGNHVQGPTVLQESPDLSNVYIDFQPADREAIRRLSPKPLSEEG